MLFAWYLALCAPSISAQARYPPDRTPYRYPTMSDSSAAGLAIRAAVRDAAPAPLPWNAYQQCIQRTGALLRTVPGSCSSSTWHFDMAFRFGSDWHRAVQEPDLDSLVATAAALVRVRTPALPTVPCSDTIQQHLSYPIHWNSWQQLHARIWHRCHAPPQPLQHIDYERHMHTRFGADWTSLLSNIPQQEAARLRRALRRCLATCAPPLARPPVPPSGHRRLSFRGLFRHICCAVAALRPNEVLPLRQLQHLRRLCARSQRSLNRTVRVPTLRQLANLRHVPRGHRL